MARLGYGERKNAVLPVQLCVKAVANTDTRFQVSERPLS